jgi:hypothetical protein
MFHFKKHLAGLRVKIVIACLFIQLIPPAGYGQDLPKIIKPSPEAAAFFRFQDYPVDYSTGLPEISVPIYEVKGRSLSLPVSLSYHASGRKVYDQDGPVAVGWSLNAGGMISRTIYGSVDFGTTANGTFKFPYPFTITNLSNATTLPYLEKVMHFDKNPDDVTVGSWLDGEYDIFSYGFGGNSGRFLFKDNNGVKTPAMLPYKPYIITPYYTQYGLTGIDILDDKGVLYKFIGSETTLQTQSPIETVPATTGYALSKIISADKTDTISFVYTGFAQTRTSISQQIIWNDNEQNFFGQPNDQIQEGPTFYENTVHDPYQVSRLTEIDFVQGKVLFNLVSGSDKIDNIQVIDQNNQVLKTVQFNRSAMDNLSEIGYSTNKLDSIVFKDAVNAPVEKYAFDYYPTVLANPAFNVRYRDWWGFYNASGVSNMMPYYTNLQYIAFNQVNIQNNYTIGNPGYNRDPNLQGLESGVLKSITYPTGGKTTFTYEKNSYFSFTAQQIKAGPGLRVAQILNDDKNGTPTLKTYTYGTNESGYGIFDMDPDITNMASEYTYNHYISGASPYYWAYRNRTFSSDFISSLSALADRPVIYPAVTEYHGTPADNTGKTVYTYDYAGWAPSGMPSFETMTIQRKHIYNYNYWNIPSLTGQTDYKSTSSNGTLSYSVRRQISNSYNAVTSETVSGLHIQRIHAINQTDRALASPSPYAEPYAAEYNNPLVNIYTYSDYQVPVGYKNLSSASETVYNDDNSSVTSTTGYTYNANQYLSQATHNTSDGNAINDKTKYPSDYTGNTVLSQMVSLNMLNFPVEQFELKNTIPIKGTRTNYFNWGSTNPMIAPQTIDVQKGANAYETRLRYTAYDSYGNPTNVSKEKDALHSFIWDYNKIYPIAEVTNAGPADIAYTSFEADGMGNWAGVGSSNIKNDVAGITGKKYYNLTGSTLTVTGLTAGTTYLVSYWSRNGSCSVSGTSAPGWPKSLRTVTMNGISWTCWEHKVSGASTISVSGSSFIDELRLYPASSQMTSYTYLPLIGASSACDANNRISYYEYDNFERLKLIRDLNGNILKTYTYRYQTTTP